MKSFRMFHSLWIVSAILALGAAIAFAQPGDSGSGAGPGAGMGMGMGKGRGERMHRMFEKHDVNNDGVVTKDEFVKGCEQRFEKLDADKDGKITKEEMEKHRETMRAKRGGGTGPKAN